MFNRIYCIFNPLKHLSPIAALLLRKVILLFLLAYLLSGYKTYAAQQPAYFTFATEQFKGVKIYDVIQDNEGHYFFSGSEGVVLFDHYQFRKMSCRESKSQSYFNFVKNKNGKIYCYNLNGQIFSISKNSFRLVYQLKSDEERNDISLCIADDNHLLIAGKKIIVLDENDQVIRRFSIAGHYIGPPHNCLAGQSIYHLSYSDSILSYHKGEFRVIPVKGLEKNRHVIQFYSLRGLEYAVDLQNKTHYSFNGARFVFQKIDALAAMQQSNALRIYETRDEIWMAGTMPGVSMHPNSAFHTLMYPDYFVSDVYKDQEGNYLISTFDKGLLVIPDLRIHDVIYPAQDDPVTALLFDADGKLWMGTSKGVLMQYSEHRLRKSDEKGIRPLEVLNGSNAFSLILYDNGVICSQQHGGLRREVLREVSLKDACIISEKEFVLGTNKGLIRVYESPLGKFEIQALKNADSRIYSMEYHPEEKRVYASTAKGFYRVALNGEMESIQKNGKDLFPNALYYDENTIYAAEKEKGILLIREAGIISEIIPEIDGSAIEIQKFMVVNEKIYARSGGRLFVFDKQGKLLHSVSEAFGFSKKRVIDFSIQNNTLAVSHEGGVQLFDLSLLEEILDPPSLHIDQVMVNDEVRDKYAGQHFSSDERKFSIRFSSPTLKHRNSVRYHFQLKGYDKNWNVQDFENNEITYSALAPGTYTFYLKAENQGVFSPAQNFTFHINFPVYLSWWFMVCCALVFIGIVILIARRQIRIQRKKSELLNQLNATRLTAIQSQMNPHFIFNSLNSIQDLILKGDVEHSYSYISTFSNLVRKTLNYSEKDFIAFEEEIQLLDIYLSLEKLRFKKDFRYHIESNAIDDILIPPLLIQPFIENALVHGLLHKEGEKILSIRFELNDALICIISDNGIGREKAKVIQQRQRMDHESFSGKAIRRRFEILSEIMSGTFGFQYEDLYENGEAAGTRVILKIPFKPRF